MTSRHEGKPKEENTQGKKCNLVEYEHLERSTWASIFLSIACVLDDLPTPRESFGFKIAKFGAPKRHFFFCYPKNRREMSWINTTTRLIARASGYEIPKTKAVYGSVYNIYLHKHTHTHMYIYRRLTQPIHQYFTKVVKHWGQRWRVRKCRRREPRAAIQPQPNHPPPAPPGWWRAPPQAEK